MPVAVLAAAGPAVGLAARSGLRCSGLPARRRRSGLADRLVRLEQRLAVGQHVAHGRLDPGRERARPDLGRQQAQVRLEVEAVAAGPGCG